MSKKYTDAVLRAMNRQSQVGGDTRSDLTLPVHLGQKTFRFVTASYRSVMLLPVHGCVCDVMHHECHAVQGLATRFRYQDLLVNCVVRIRDKPHQRRLFLQGCSPDAQPLQS